MESTNGCHKLPLILQLMPAICQGLKAQTELIDSEQSLQSSLTVVIIITNSVNELPKR